MPEDPIGREIRQLREDNAEDFAQLRSSVNEGLAQIRSAMAGLVPRELHDVQLERLRDQVATVSRDLEKFIAKVDADRKAEVDKRDANQRVTKGAVIGAIAGIVLQILNSVGVLP